ncbi:hypothetical protein ACJ7V3_13140 [Halomonas elongata]
MQLNGKTALVISGGQGIAMALADAGANVTVADQDIAVNGGFSL